VIEAVRFIEEEPDGAFAFVDIASSDSASMARAIWG